MTIYEAIHALVGFPHLCALRMPGPVLTLTPHNRVMDLQGPKPRRYVPSFRDLVGIDWQVMKIQDFVRLVNQQQEAAAAAAAADNGAARDNPLEGQE